jgi:hypothetical protein
MFTFIGSLFDDIGSTTAYFLSDVRILENSNSEMTLKEAAMA